MSDSDELRDIKPYGFEPLAKITIDAINCVELDTANADVDLEQPPVSPILDTQPQQELGWYIFVCLGISLIDKSTHWA